METHIFPSSHSQAQSDNHFLGQCDTGAQYFTNFRHEERNIYDLLEQQHFLQAFDARSALIKGIKSEYENLPHYFAPKGTQSIVQFLLQGSNVRKGVQARAIDMQGKGIAVQGQLLNATSIEESIVFGMYDIVAITSPAPSVLTMEGEFKRHVEVLLRNVRYSSRYSIFTILLTILSWRCP